MCGNVQDRSTLSATGMMPTVSFLQEADEEPLLKPFAPESAFHILPTHTAAHYSPV